MNHCYIVCKFVVSLLFCTFCHFVLGWKIQESKWFRLWQERTWDGGVAGLDCGGPSPEASICYYWECCNASSFRFKECKELNPSVTPGGCDLSIGCRWRWYHHYRGWKACRLVKKMHVSWTCGVCRVKDFCTLGTELKGQAMAPAVSES